MKTQHHPNTKIEYLYRDAGNYKVHNEAIIEGQLTPEQQKIILSCLDEGEYFIPHLVGLPEKRFDDYDEEADHPWFELDKHSFTQTTDPPSFGISSDQLVHAFLQCKNRWAELTDPVLDPSPPSPQNSRGGEGQESFSLATTPEEELARERPHIAAQIRILSDAGLLTSDEDLFCGVYLDAITAQYVNAVHQWEQTNGVDVPFHVELKLMQTAIGQMAVNAKSPTFPQEHLADTDLYRDALTYFIAQADRDIENDLVRAHAAELILCYEHQMDLLDFDFWTQYEVLLCDRLTLDEYRTVDRLFAGDPLDVTAADKTIIDGWRADLEDYRERQALTLEDRIHSAAEQIPNNSVPSHARDHGHEL